MKVKLKIALRQFFYLLHFKKIRLKACLKKFGNAEEELKKNFLINIEKE